MNRTIVQNETITGAKQCKVKAGISLSGGHLKRFCVPLLFFSFFFFFLLLYIDPSIIHSSNGFNIHTYVSIMHAPDASAYADLLYRPLFILELTPEYLREIIITPGGWTRLIITLCIYVCHYPIAGSIVLTGLAIFFYWIFMLYINGCGTRRPFVLSFAPAFFILISCAWYELSYCMFLLPIGGALVFTVIYQHLRTTTIWTSMLWLTMLFWISWYFMQWGCLLLLVFTVVHELFSKKRRIIPVAITVTINGILFYFVDGWLIPLNMMIRWSDFTMLSGLPIAVISFFPLAATGLALLSRLRHPLEGRSKTICAIVRFSLLACFTAAISLWICRETVNRDTRIIARTVYHVIKGQWNKVLQEKTAHFFTGFPQKAGVLQVFMMHVVNHALCNTGHIGDKMFTFPQAVFSYDPLLMMQGMNIHSYVNWIVVLDLAMDLGMVNAAEKIAGEIMENMGPYPEILYRRALVQFAKGHSEAAAVYLNKLARMPFYRKEAKRLLSTLKKDGFLLSEPRISTMRANMDTVDYFLNNNLNGDFMLKYLLQSNHRNKTAYDYLMTFCLLYDRLDEMAALAPAASAYGYTTLPRYWEEALCLYQSATALQASSGDPFSGLGQQTVERFIAFTKAWVEKKDDPGAALTLAPLFGDSYFFYSIFRYSPGTVLHD